VKDLCISHPRVKSPSMMNPVTKSRSLKNSSNNSSIV
jgi:hypothetical protein